VGGFEGVCSAISSDGSPQSHRRAEPWDHPEHTGQGRFSAPFHAIITLLPLSYYKTRADGLELEAPKKAEFMTDSTIRLRNPLLAAFLAWLVPGLGHYYQGRIGKAILYATCILGLFFLGMLMGEGKIVYWRWVSPFNSDKFCLYYPGQFFVGLPALPALIQATLNHYGQDPILWGFMAEPSQIVLNGLHPKLGKLVEIGTIYTTVAGLLNILAIYDAYEGPAFIDSEEETDRSGSSALAASGGLKPEGSA
jgi:hypothetical protein